MRATTPSLKGSRRGAAAAAALRRLPRDNLGPKPHVSDLPASSSHPGFLRWKVSRARRGIRLPRVRFLPPGLVVTAFTLRQMICNPTTPGLAPGRKSDYFPPAFSVLPLAKLLSRLGFPQKMQLQAGGGPLPLPLPTQGGARAHTTPRNPRSICPGLLVYRPSD